MMTRQQSNRRLRGFWDSSNSRAGKAISRPDLVAKYNATGAGRDERDETRGTVTAELLRKLEACSEQVEKFEELFPNGVVVTEALCVQHADLFDWNWAARNLLSADVWAEYERVRAAAGAEYKRVTAPARAEYERVTAPARAEYERVTAPALAEYDRVEAPAWAEYKRVRAAARAEYRRVTAAARAEYDRVTAAAWAEYDRVRAAAWAEYRRVRAAAFGRLASTDKGANES